MEFKGTKGKWEINAETESRIVMLNGSIDVWAFDIDSNFDNEEAKANAQLISKAPEMLEMLLKIRNKQPINTKQLDQLIKEATTI